MSIIEEEELERLAATPPPAEAPEASEAGWKRDKSGREYVAKPDGPGMVFRRGQETVSEALERNAQGGGDKRPRRRKPVAPPPPAAVDLRELEQLFSEAFKSPAMIAGMVGDEWLADHFVDKGPYLARNLVKASETNPWLRRKLEEMAAGGDVTVQILGTLSLAGAVILYAAPPLIYLLNLPVPARARVMLDIPERRLAPAPSASTPFVPYAPPVADAASAETPESPLEFPVD